PLPYSTLLRVGFAWPTLSPGSPVRSYRTVSPLPSGSPRSRHSARHDPIGLVATRDGSSREDGGLLSVALSFGSPRLGVTQHPALWSSDFPPVARRPPAIPQVAA